MYERALGLSLNDLFDTHCSGDTPAARFVGVGLYQSLKGEYICVSASGQKDCYYKVSPEMLALLHDASVAARHGKGIDQSPCPLISYINLKKLMLAAGLDATVIYRISHLMSSEIPVKLSTASFINDDSIITRHLSTRYTSSMRSSYQFDLLDSSAISKWQAYSFRCLAYGAYALVHTILGTVTRLSYLASSNREESLKDSCATLKCLWDEYALEVNAHYMRLANECDLAGLGCEIKFTLDIIIDTFKYCFQPIVGGSNAFCWESRHGYLSEIVEQGFFVPLLRRVRAANAFTNFTAT